MEFWLDANLVEIIVDPNNKNYSSEDGVIFNKDKTELIFYCKNNSNGDYIIPSGVTTIDSNAFYISRNLTRLGIPDSVTNIKRNAIFGTIKLNSIVVDANNKNYSSDGGVLFNKNKTELKLYSSDNEQSSYSIPSGVTSVDSYAFTNCNNLSSLTIPDSIKSIGESAFFGCTNLNNITIPSAVTCIGNTLQDRVNCINMTNSRVILGYLNDFMIDTNPDVYQSADGISFYRTATSTAVSTDTVEQATSTGTATTSQITRTGDASVLPVLVMMALGAIGMKKIGKR